MPRRSRLYCPDLGLGIVRIRGPEVHHARNVLRVQPGQALGLFDGRGRSAPGEVLAVARDTVTVRVETLETEPDARLRVVLAAAIPKPSAQACLIAHGTETGIDAFWPVIYSRSSVRRLPRAKWERWSVESCKQCGRNRLPDIPEPMTLDEAVARVGDFDFRAFGSTSEEAISMVSALPAGWKNIILFIGPEGGMTDAEERLLASHNVRPVRLGRYVLRIETAGPALAAALIFARSGE